MKNGRPPPCAPSLVELEVLCVLFRRASWTGVAGCFGYFGYFGYRQVGSYSGLGGSAERPRRGADDRTGSAAAQPFSAAYVPFSCGGAPAAQRALVYTKERFSCADWPRLSCTSSCRSHVHPPSPCPSHATHPLLLTSARASRATRSLQIQFQVISRKVTRADELLHRLCPMLTNLLPSTVWTPIVAHHHVMPLAPRHARVVSVHTTRATATARACHCYAHPTS